MTLPSYLRGDFCPACGKARLLSRGDELRCKACKATFAEDGARTNHSPDVLSTLGEPGTIVESQGVQFVMSFHAEGEVVPGSAHRITITFQNCWNAERTVSVRLMPKSFGGLGFGRGVVELRKTTSLPLSPLEIGRLTLRVRLPERASGKYRVEGVFDVTGDGGQRLVRTQRPVIEKRVSAFEVLLGLGAGWIPDSGYGDGYFVEIQVTKGEPKTSGHDEIPEMDYSRVTLR